MRITIKAKLSLAFGFVVIMTSVMAALAVTNLASLNDDITMMVKGPMATVNITSEMTTKAIESVKIEKDLVLNTDPAQIAIYDRALLKVRQEVIDDYNKSLLAADPETKAKLVNSTRRGKDGFRSRIKSANLAP